MRTLVYILVRFTLNIIYFNIIIKNCKEVITISIKSFFSRDGWYLLILSMIVFIIFTIFLPNILSATGLLENETWPLTTKRIVQLTVGSWCATFITSAARVYVWVQAMRAKIPSTQYLKIRDEVKTIQTFFLWLFGIMTVLSGYVTQWFSSTGVT
jgi:hypothetical protein